MITIYVLKCSNNKYYIGKTLSDVNKRFNIHKKGQGAIWTRKHRPVEILNVYKNCESITIPKKILFINPIRLIKK